MNEVRILWVDDEVDLLKSHVLFLRGKGYDVDTCNNGADAIEMVRTTPYDLIILDEMMPGMTGLETLPLIKEQRPTTPVIMVTKSEEESIMDKAIGSKNSSSPSGTPPTTVPNSGASPPRWPTPATSENGVPSTKNW